MKLLLILKSLVVIVALIVVLRWASNRASTKHRRHAYASDALVPLDENYKYKVRHLVYYGPTHLYGGQKVADTFKRNGYLVGDDTFTDTSYLKDWDL
jgi:hypothetical protein